MEQNVRDVAWRLLCRAESAGQYSNLALDTALKRDAVAEADRALLTVLVYGVLERRRTLDYWIERLSARPEETLEPEVRMLLRLGLYQMAYLDRVPDHAAVNETVALAPRRARGFVNALLRAFARRGKQVELPDAATDPVTHLAVRFSVGEALAARFLERWGFSRTEQLLKAFEERSSLLTLRVNTLRTTREAYIEELLKRGIEARPTAVARDGVQLESRPITSLYGFEEGLFFVQDEASMRCTEALDAFEGARVLDLCACPGSKTFGLAIDMKNRGSLVARDLHANKLSLVARGAERLGISILTVEEGDARRLRAEERGLYDRVLCDVPCSGFGVIGKKPELRYKDPKESCALPDIQLEIARTGAEYLKEGGRMVYSTCTLLPEENEENVVRLLAACRFLRLVEERTLLPDTDGCDGFYYAVLERTSL